MENNLEQQLEEKKIKNSGIYSAYHGPQSQEWIDGLKPLKYPWFKATNILKQKNPSIKSQLWNPQKCSRIEKPH